jgi:hypothetical protein
LAAAPIVGVKHVIMILFHCLCINILLK